MQMYHNIMEDLVEQRLTELYRSLSCCDCEICRNDIMAYALNHLPSKYVVTDTGGVYSKMFTLRQQHDTDIIAAITLGANLIRENPRHDVITTPQAPETVPQV